jgi:predicted acetyltransferase
MAVDVRTIRASEVSPWVDAMRAGFLESPAPTPAEADWRATFFDLDHTWGAFDGDRVVGTLRSFDTRVSVPGRADIAATALTHVAVSASHRRQGLLSRMISADLAACAERGDAVSVLIAAEYPIYGRFGYGPTTEGVDFEIDTVGLTVTGPRTGSIETVDRDTYRAAVPAIYDRFRVAQPGSILRDDWWWDVSLGVVALEGRTAPKFFALSRTESGEADGFVAYRIEDHWVDVRPRSKMLVDDLVGVDTSSTVRLWRYCIETDWIGTVRADHRNVEDPLRWHLDDARAMAERERSDLLWLRILDLPQALAGRSYLAEGSVVLEVKDPLGFASGRVRLDGGPSGATCTPTDAATDLALSVQVLSSAYLGGYTLASMAAAGLVTECTPGSLATADAMFRSAVAPSCPTHF